ncbi:MAG: branched-chain amino acid transport system ATP-binding protein [Cellvibrionaceae bacterium]|jgi:branched-chain amino acid transport system ATP-binding protein
MLKVSNLSVSIQKIPILQEVDLQINEGAMVGLIGRNGAGKTTFMRSIMGLLDAEGGEVWFEDKNLLEQQAHYRANHNIGYLPEDRRLISHFTVEENIMVPLWATKRMKDVDRVKWVYELMPEIARFKDRQAMTLSGGQQKLVALARALVCGSKLLLLDEPFEGVAPALAERLMDVLSSLKEKQVSVLISESDYTHSKNLVDNVYVIERGKINQG